MNAKTFLSQAYRLDLKISSDIEELNNLSRMYGFVQAVKYDETKLDGTHSTDAPFIRHVEKYLELEQQIKDELDYLVKLKEQIRNVINLVEDEEENVVLRLRYLNRYSWDKISSQMQCTNRNAHYLHSKALRSVDRILEKNS